LATGLAVFDRMHAEIEERFLHRPGLPAELSLTRAGA
jgi:hypothetical protein